MVIVNKATNFELKGVVAVMNVPRQGPLHTLDGLIRDNTSNLTEYRNDAAYSSLLVQADFIDGGRVLRMIQSIYMSLICGIIHT